MSSIALDDRSRNISWQAAPIHSGWESEFLEVTSHLIITHLPLRYALRDMARPQPGSDQTWLPLLDGQV
jgi:hypothetical protein